MSLDQTAQALRAKAADLSQQISDAEARISSDQALVSSLTPQRDLHLAAANSIDGLPADHKALIDGLPQE